MNENDCKICEGFGTYPSVNEYGQGVEVTCRCVAEFAVEAYRRVGLYKKAREIEESMRGVKPQSITPRKL